MTIGGPAEQAERPKIGISKALTTMFVLATREGLTSALLQQVDPVVKKAKNNVSAEYPVESLKYPGIWVTTSFNSLKWISLNSELIHPEGYKYNIGEFEAKINFEAMALSNEERDALVDALVNMLMFGNIESDSDKFHKFLVREQYIAITSKLGELSLGQNSVSVGTPWSPNQLAYTRSVSFDIRGEFAQRLDNQALIPLREIDVALADTL